jgi:hypothetical protein
MTDTIMTSDDAEQPSYARRLGTELRPILACGHAITALGTGTQALATRTWDWCTESGEWRGLGKRGAGLLAAAAVAGQTIHHHAAVGIPAAVCAWCVAAWMHSPEPVPGETLPESAEQSSGEQPEQAPLTLVTWLEQVTRGRTGIHLGELYSLLRQVPSLADHSDPQLRALLDHHGVPVQRTLRVGAVAGRSGVSRKAVEELLQAPSPALSPDCPQEAASGAESDMESGADLRKSPPALRPSPVLESALHSPPPAF